MIQAIDACRGCGGHALEPLLDLGRVPLPGLFPATAAAPVPDVPLRLVRCAAAPPDGCGLVQLGDRLDLAELRAADYGGGAWLSAADARRRQGLVERLKRHVRLTAHDVVVDIGPPGPAVLGAFEPGGPLLLAVHPHVGRARRLYRADVEIVPQPFSAAALRARLAGRKVKLAFAVGALGAAEDPTAVLREVARSLDDEGVVCFEEVYLPAVLRDGAIDALRPETGIYLTVGAFEPLARNAGLKILDVHRSDAGGGRVAVTLARTSSPRGRPPSALGWYADNEATLGVHVADTYRGFATRLADRAARLGALLDRIRGGGESVAATGASPGGNALLHRFDVGPGRVERVGSDNPQVVGRFTAGTGIPIVAEDDVRAARPDYLMVLPWHHRDEALRHEEPYLRDGGKVIFPLPDVEIVGS